jgi:hypothetical protein
MESKFKKCEHGRNRSMTTFTRWKVVKHRGINFAPACDFLAFDVPRCRSG